jgi:flavin reductase (DIM6/NTAB) family NADH-FMN oxidoreductase RutF
VDGPDLARYREVAGHFATGVVVVTSLGPDGPIGFTCQTFGSHSLDPVLVTFSARTSSVSWPQMREVGPLAVNVLAAHQDAIALTFAVTAADKFDSVPWHAGDNGAPLIDGALACMEGRLVEVTTFGDHDIAVAAIDRAELGGGVPLVYYRGSFGTFSP